MASGAGKIFDLLNGFRKSKVLFVATKLQIFDSIAVSGPATTNIIANRLSLNENALNTLLHSCVALDLLSKEQNQFQLSNFAKKYLVSTSPDSLSGLLEKSIKTGNTSWKESKLLNCNDDVTEEEVTKSAFSQLYKTEESLERFLKGMHGLSVSCAPALVTSFDLSRFKTLVDLGGGSGALVYEACKQYPELRGSVFDLSSTLSFSQSSLLRQSSSTPLIMQRISLIPGNFFEDSLPDSDLFSLSRIIHDWNEEKVKILLKKIYEKLPAGGGLLICEMLLDEDGCGPVDTLLQSLNMLVQTGGTERKYSEYKAMLLEVGFSQVDFKKTNEYLDAILATK